MGVGSEKNSTYDNRDLHFVNFVPIINNNDALRNSLTSATTKVHSRCWSRHEIKGDLCCWTSRTPLHGGRPLGGPGGDGNAFIIYGHSDVSTAKHARYETKMHYNNTNNVSRVKPETIRSIDNCIRETFTNKCNIPPRFLYDVSQCIRK